jgi:site-specific DNA-methyltransferase (adenine-specific)
MTNLYHGDCLDILPTLPAQSVDAVICDIPSGRTACAWDVVIPFDAMWANLKRLVKPRGAAVLLGCTQPFTSMLVMSNLREYRHSWAWDKKRCTGGTARAFAPMKAHEDIVVFGEQAPKYNPQMGSWEGITLTRKKTVVTVANGRHIYATHVNEGKDAKLARGRFPDSVIRIPALGSNHPERVGHETQKPVALMEYLIRTYTNEGDTVLDFAAGSGTTGVACVNTGRQFIGIEKERPYFDIAERRISDAQAAMVQLELVA